MMKRIPGIVPILALTALAALPVGLTMATPVAADCTTGMGTCYDDDEATCVIFDPNGHSDPVVVHDACDGETKGCA